MTPTRPLICLDCPKELSSRNVTGRCRICALLYGCRNTDMHARRIARQRQRMADPAEKAKHVVKCRAARLRSLERPEVRERHLAMARSIGAANFVHAHTPEALERAKAARLANHWCPEEHRELNRTMRLKRVPLAERKRIISELVPGTAEHGRRIVDNNVLVARLRHERQRMEAY